MLENSACFGEDAHVFQREAPFDRSLIYYSEHLCDMSRAEPSPVVVVTVLIADFMWGSLQSPWLLCLIAVMGSLVMALACQSPGLTRALLIQLIGAVRSRG
jgi:hypothetical protein